MRKEAECQLPQKGRHDHPLKNLKNKNPALKDAQTGLQGAADNPQLAHHDCEEKV